MSSFFFSHIWVRVLVFYDKEGSKKRRPFVCEPFLFSPLDEAGWCFMITRRGAWVSSSLQVTHTSPQGCIHISICICIWASVSVNFCPCHTRIKPTTMNFCSYLYLGYFCGNYCVICTYNQGSAVCSYEIAKSYLQHFQFVHEK